MGLVLPTIAAYHVQHLPIVKAYADTIGVVEVLNQLVPTEMAVDPGTIVLGMILETLSGRSPLYRLEEVFAHQDPALLLGQVIAPDAFHDDTVGRVLERLYTTGTMAKENYYLEPISQGEQGVPPVGTVPGVAADAKQRFIWGPTVPVRQLQREDSREHETYVVHPRQIVCAEPSPDALSTFSSSVAAALRADVRGQVSAGGEVSRSLSETARILGQRTPTIQLLRDGFYRACEAYGNGLIDSFGYALILNNIDRVMVRLLAIDALGQGQLKEGDVTKIQQSAEAETAAEAASAALQAAQEASAAARTRVENLRAQQRDLAGRIASLKAEEAQAKAAVEAATKAKGELPNARKTLTDLVTSIGTAEAAKKTQDQIVSNPATPDEDRKKATQESQKLAGELAGLLSQKQTAEKNLRDIEAQVDDGERVKGRPNQLAARLGTLEPQKTALDTDTTSAEAVEQAARTTETNARSAFASAKVTAEGKQATLGTIRTELSSAAMSQIVEIVRETHNYNVFAHTAGACALWFAQHPSVKVWGEQYGQGFTFVDSDVPMIARWCAAALRGALQAPQPPATVGQPLIGNEYRQNKRPFPPTTAPTPCWGRPARPALARWAPGATATSPCPPASGWGLRDRGRRQAGNGKREILGTGFVIRGVSQCKTRRDRIISVQRIFTQVRQV